MHYSVGYNNPNFHFIEIEFSFRTKGVQKQIVNLPAWRPGRYELGNFAKNIQKIQAFSGDREIAMKKIIKDSWELNTDGLDEVRISYNYFAHELNAGSTYLDADQLYVNGVNCFLYLPDRQDEKCSLSIDVPDDYKIACGLKEMGKNKFEATDFHELVDCPFIASKTLKHHQFKAAGINFHLWFQGECKPDFEQLERDFYPFCKYQMEFFGELPVEDYHFMYQILPYKAYHGVEHSNSTVCLLGPSYDIFKKEGMYLELLGVSSHELFHAWNVKRIRPIEMWPYDYSKENYSRLGYLAEGATTFYGDWLLLRSGVFSEAEYFKTFEELLSRHYNNPGVLNMSVADSSFDLWLDGYVAGIPNRKSSIYTEGALITFCLDILIGKFSKEQHTFDDVLKEFYSDFFQKNKGISEADYKAVVEKYAQTDLTDFFDQYINGYKDISGILKECLNFIGLEFNKKQGNTYAESYLGIKYTLINNKLMVISVFPGSPAERAGLSVEDELLSINSFAINNDLDKWLQYFEGEEISLKLKRKYGKILELKMTAPKEIFYANYVLNKMEHVSVEQERRYREWRR